MKTTVKTTVWMRHKERERDVEGDFVCASSR